jgi:hypothetical protein
VNRVKLLFFWKKNSWIFWNDRNPSFIYFWLRMVVDKYNGLWIHPFMIVCSASNLLNQNCLGLFRADRQISTPEVCGPWNNIACLETEHRDTSLQKFGWKIYNHWVQGRTNWHEKLNSMNSCQINFYFEQHNIVTIIITNNLRALQYIISELLYTVDVYW